MSLDTGKLALEQGILDLQREMIEKDTDAMEHFAKTLTELIYNFVKSGELQVDAEILVTTSAGSGSTTSIGTGKIK